MSEDIPFQRQDLASRNINLSTLHMVSHQQLVSVKAKVINIQPESIVKIGYRDVNKADALLIDPHGLFKIVFWGDDIEKVTDGGTYQFKNLRLRHSKNDNSFYVNPAKTDSDITESEAEGCALQKRMVFKSICSH